MTLTNPPRAPPHTDSGPEAASRGAPGAGPGSVRGVVSAQGWRPGIVGTASGVGRGLAVAFHIDIIVPAIERALGVAFLPGSIYLISRMPSEPMAADIVPIALISLGLAFVATLYPSWRASRIRPAEALRHE